MNLVNDESLDYKGTARSIEQGGHGKVKVMVEIKDKDEMKKIYKIFGKNHVSVVTSQRERILDSIFDKFRVKLPARYKFDREDCRRKQGPHSRRRVKNITVIAAATTGLNH